MPSHTEAERRKVRALISRPIDSLSGVPRQRAKIQRKVLNLKANPRALLGLSQVRPSTRPAAPIIQKTQPTDITGKAQNIRELIKKRQRLLQNF